MLHILSISPTSASVKLLKLFRERLRGHSSRLYVWQASIRKIYFWANDGALLILQDELAYYCFLLELYWVCLHTTHQNSLGIKLHSATVNEEFCDYQEKRKTNAQPRGTDSKFNITAISKLRNISELSRFYMPNYWSIKRQLRVLNKYKTKMVHFTELIRLSCGSQIFLGTFSELNFSRDTPNFTKKVLLKITKTVNG